jgi:hypothetical protein
MSTAVVTLTINIKEAELIKTALDHHGFELVYRTRGKIGYTEEMAEVVIEQGEAMRKLKRDLFG